MIILGALDTGSAFEGMGASREAQFSILVEPTIFLVLCSIAIITKNFALSEMFSSLGAKGLSSLHSAVFLVGAAAFFLVTLAECSRIPVDDPNTHLELTMIHEAMILDNSGPDLALLEYASALKLWMFSALTVAIIFPYNCGGPIGLAYHNETAN